MKIFLDTANLDELKKGAEWGVVDGVTTNPSLIAKEGRPIAEQVRMICDIIDGDISAEVVATEAKEMIREGRAEPGRLPRQCDAVLCAGTGAAGGEGGSVHREPVRGTPGRYRLDRDGSNPEHHHDL